VRQWGFLDVVGLCNVCEILVWKWVTIPSPESRRKGNPCLGVELGHSVSVGHKRRVLVLKVGGWTQGYPCLGVELGHSVTVGHKRRVLVLKVGGWTQG
jgi:flagellar biogenesis protein FliO